MSPRSVVRFWHATGPAQPSLEWPRSDPVRPWRINFLKVNELVMARWAPTFTKRIVVPFIKETVR